MVDFAGVAVRVSKRAFPIVVRKGSVEVKIYRCKSKMGYVSYTVCYYQDGVRKRPTFADLKKAQEEADFVVERLGSTNADVLTLTSADRAAYLRARQLLDPIGVGIEMAAAQFADAKARLGNAPLSAVVDYYLRQRPPDPKVRKVADVIEDLVEAKEKDGRSDVYVKALRYSLGKFAERFKGNILDVTGPEIDSWLRDSGRSARTRNNMRRALQTLFKFAKSRRYLPKDHDEISSVSIVKEARGTIEIFTPAELEEVMRCANGKMIPFLALGAFAGVRHAEIQRLSWRDVRFDEGFIEVAAMKAKTASRRLVPLRDNLKEWLAPHRQEEEDICEVSNGSNAIVRIIARVNAARKAKGNGEEFHWKSNALRHSFISYRLAEVQNADQVALEAGTSRQMIFTYYRELVTPKAAEEWFGIRPERAGDADKDLGSGI